MFEEQPKEFIRLLEKYVDKFKENFPIFTVMGLEESEIKAMIQKCLDDNKPFEVKDDGKTDY